MNCLTPAVLCLAFIIYQHPQEPILLPKSEIPLKVNQLAATDIFAALAYSPDGKWLASAGPGKEIRLWDVKTGKELQKFPCPPNGVLDVAFSPDGKLLAGCNHRYGNEDTIHVWEVESGKKLWSGPGLPHGGYRIRFSPDGKILTLRRGQNQDSRIWDARTGKELLRQFYDPNDQALTALAFSPDGKWWAICSDPRTIHLWDTRKNLTIRSIRLPLGSIQRADICPDNQLLFAGSAVWQIATGKRLFHLNLEENHAFSPDGRLLAQPINGRDIGLYEVYTGGLITTLKGHTQWVHKVAFSPDGKWLVSGSAPPPIGLPPQGDFRDKSLRIWNMANFQEMASSSLANNFVQNLVIAPDSRAVAVSFRTKASIWQLPKVETPRGKMASMTRQELEQAWTSLGSADAEHAYRTMSRLADASESALSLFKNRLMNPQSEERVQILIDRLDHNRFVIRDQSERELRILGIAIEPLLKKALENNPSQEAATRLRGLLKSYKDEKVRRIESIRQLRCLQVLERIGTEQAIAMIREFTGDPENPLLVWHARSTRERLAKEK